MARMTTGVCNLGFAAVSVLVAGHVGRQKARKADIDVVEAWSRGAKNPTV